MRLHRTPPAPFRHPLYNRFTFLFERSSLNRLSLFVLGRACKAVAFIGAVRLAAGLERSPPKNEMRIPSIFITLPATLVIVRVSIFWLLFYLQRTGKESLSLLPLVLALFPEGLIAPDNQPWTPATGIIFSLLLFIGSCIIGIMIALVISKLRKTCK